MTQVKLYEAVDMGEALKMVKSDLGPDAVILSSRKIMKGAGSFGLFGRPVIEVTAALPRQARGARENGRRLSEKMYATKAPSRPVADVSHTPSMSPVIDGIEEIRQRLNTISTRENEPDNTAERVADDVRELKSMISYLLDQSRIEKEKGMDRSFLALLRILTERGLAAEYAQSIIDEIGGAAEGGPAPDLKTLLYVAANRLRQTLLFDGWIDRAGDDGHKNVIAIVGPTGVGKTTTVAKLAAILTQRKLKVGLVTIDTYRIAAIEQLKIYANILNIPLEVVLSPGDLVRTLHLYRKMDVVLIDTAGRSQRDVEQIGELKRFFDKCPEVDARLALSASSSERQMAEAARNFSTLPLSGLIFTKLDEAVSLGEVINMQLKTGLPISYFTTGQRVPEDIEEATAKRLMSLFFKTEKQAAFAV